MYEDITINVSEPVYAEFQAASKSAGRVLRPLTTDDDLLDEMLRPDA